MKVNPIENEEKPSFWKLFKNWKVKSFRIVSVLSILIFISMVGAGPNSSIVQVSDNLADTVSIKTEQLYVESVKTRANNELIKEVAEYMYRIAPETKISPSYLVHKCQQYDIDIVFVLAQGILESHLGTKGIAKTTNSVWNVGTYDDGQILYTYGTPNESIEPYLALLKDKYLMKITSNGDTIQTGLHTLLDDRGYKNMHGNRFATARGYENALRKIIIKIDLETSISMHQSIANLKKEEILAYFGPINNKELAMN